VIVDASAFLVALANPDAGAGFSNGEVAAPDLLIVEALNALWKLARAGRRAPPTEVVLELLDHIRIVPSRPYAPRAARLAQELDHPVYDCLYLSLAEAHGEILVTADARLLRKVARTRLHERVRLLSL